MSLEISQNLQENTCARVSFLIKLQLQPVNIAKLLKIAFPKEPIAFPIEPMTFIKPLLWAAFSQNASVTFLFRLKLKKTNFLVTTLQLNTKWKVSVFGAFLVRIQSEWGKIRTRITSRRTLFTTKRANISVLVA